MKSEMNDEEAYFGIDRAVAIALIIVLLSAAYFVVQKTRHDGSIAADTRRVAEAVERMEMSLRYVEVARTHPYIQVPNREPETCK